MQTTMLVCTCVQLLSVPLRALRLALFACHRAEKMTTYADTWGTKYQVVGDIQYSYYGRRLVLPREATKPALEYTLC